jgi:hypothetical protein
LPIALAIIFFIITFPFHVELPFKFTIWNGPTLSIYWDAPCLPRLGPVPPPGEARILPELWLGGPNGRDDWVAAIDPVISRNLLGFSYSRHPMVRLDRGRYVSDATEHGLSIPDWFQCAFFIAIALPILRMLLRTLRALRRERLGLCPACGYDLRASPARCPECGHKALSRPNPLPRQSPSAP